MGNSSSTSVSNSPRGIGDWFRDAGVRETWESVIVAVMLALLFKAFEAEAFVIPTGSMAPTLQGQHKDVVCPKCGFRYRVNASVESRGMKRIIETTCPICRYTQEIDVDENPNHDTFSGDRILVSKFAYDIAEPNRWDVIVFRYPDNAKQNYIKRLTGLPNEHLLIESGDLHVWNPPEDAGEGMPDNRSQFSIVRKPPRKLLSMLQLVDDTNYLPPELVKVDWPLRWQDWSATSDQQTWTADLASGSPVYTIAPHPQLNWLRYRHLVPRRTEWTEISAGRLPKRMNNPQGELISDYYEYNDYGYELTTATEYKRNKVYDSEPIPHWVGDLVLDANIKLDSNEGTLFLECLEGGIKFTCAIDVKTGAATVSADSDRVRFDQADGSEGSPSTVAQGQTSVRGGRSYRVRYGNVDDRIYLWINNRVVEFDLPMTFRREGSVLPEWSDSNPGDAEPLGIGAQNLSMSVDRLRVWRDIYYIGSPGVLNSDYRNFSGSVRDILQTPQRWATSQDMFRSRERDPKDSFLLLDDQFFALGDNSPASSDARAWVGHHYVERENLVGKALFVYWPHSWWSPIPFLPNFKRMGFIR